MNERFLQQIADCVSGNLPHQARHAKVQVYIPKSSVRLYYPEFDSSYYELSLADKAVEIGFSFTGSKTKNTSRLALFEAHFLALQPKLERPLQVESWQVNWIRTLIRLPKETLTGEQVEAYAQALLKFLDLTYPLLCQAFEAVPIRSKKPFQPPTLNPKHHGAYIILSRHLDQVQAFLQGRIKRPTDDVLCDWVHFCYTFEQYKEGAELFKLIDPDAVQPWLYERARRLGKVCQMRAK